MAGYMAVVPSDDCHTYADAGSEKEELFPGGCPGDRYPGVVWQECLLGEGVRLLFCGVADLFFGIEVEERGTPGMEQDVAYFVEQVEPEDVWLAATSC